MENPQQEATGHLQGGLRKALHVLSSRFYPRSRGAGSIVVGFLFENHGGSKIAWGFGKSVGCAAFWWGIGGIGGGIEIVVGYFSMGSVGGGSKLLQFPIEIKFQDEQCYRFRRIPK